MPLFPLRRYGFAILLVAAPCLIGMPRSASAQFGKTTKITGPRIAVFRISGAIPEKPTGEAFPFAMEETTTLKDLIVRMRKARGDEQVKGVVLSVSQGAAPGRAQVEELRQAILELRSAGKEVHAHTDSMSTTTYTLLSGVSRLSVVPTGDVWLMGFYGESPYLRGLLNNVGITPDFISMGAYKSAAEMFMRESPSTEAEEMQNWLLDSLFETTIDLIAKGRGKTADQVRGWIDAGPYTAEKAAETGLIDAVQTHADFVADLKQRYGKEIKFDGRYGVKRGPEIDLSSMMGVFQFYAELLSPPKKAPKKDAIGIVYVEGAIALGSDQASPFGGSAGAMSTTVRKALEKAANDDSVKAVVLRVNSPGGSATASEIILNATKKLKEKKPFVVSMGDVAGSGGYYVACAADTIFADRATITGSIGVVGGKFATTGMWDKVGIRWKTYQRGVNAGLLSSTRVFSDGERKHMLQWMGDIYKVFTDHVVAIRGKKLAKPIDELAGGRVFTGAQALKLGLVDKIGTLDDAVRHVAAQVNLKEYEIRAVPRPKNFMEQLMESASGKSEFDSAASITVEPGSPTGTNSLLQLALPALKGMDPLRFGAIKSALLRLEMLQREGVGLTMPEFVIRDR